MDNLPLQGATVAASTKLFANLTLSAGDGKIATIYADGRVEVHKDGGAPEAARAFWEHFRNPLTTEVERLTVENQRLRIAAAGQQPMAGWVVADHRGKRYRCLDDLGCPRWTDEEDIQKALWFSRREDADAFCAEDEDAWLILPVFAPTRKDAKVVQRAVEHRFASALIRHQTMGDGPTGQRLMVDVQDLLATYNEGRDEDPLTAPPIPTPPMTEGWQRMTDEARALQRRHLGTNNGVYHAMQWLCSKFGAQHAAKPEE